MIKITILKVNKWIHPGYVLSKAAWAKIATVQDFSSGGNYTGFSCILLPVLTWIKTMIQTKQVLNYVLHVNQN